MGFVVDASVILAWLLPDERSEFAQAVMTRAAREDAQAPALLHQEIGNALLQAARRRRISGERAAEMLELFLALPIALQSPDAESTRQALEIAVRQGLSLYDACYVELARRRRMPLATLDEALRRAATSEQVTLIG